MIKRQIPNMVTLFNLSLGMIAIMLTFNGSFLLACLIILVACFLDRYDGKIARRLNVSSEMGKELDSLADLISFGVAPAIITWRISFAELGIIGYILVLLFLISGAYRLARFNTLSLINIFLGIPITIAGAILVISDLYLIKYGTHLYLSAILLILLSFLMISKIRVPKI